MGDVRLREELFVRLELLDYICILKGIRKEKKMLMTKIRGQVNERVKFQRRKGGWDLENKQRVQFLMGIGIFFYGYRREIDRQLYIYLQIDEGVSVSYIYFFN